MTFASKPKYVGEWIAEPMRVCDLIEELKKFPPLMPVVVEGEGALAEVIRAENYEVVLQGAIVWNDDVR